MSQHHQTAFESLHEQYSEMVMQLCLGFAGADEATAADLSQDVFINIWNALPGFREDAAYKTWIYRITINTCLQHKRKDKNKLQVPVANIEHFTEEKTVQATAENQQQLYSAIGRLKEVDRIVIMLVLEGLEYEETAAITGISAVNLRVKIHRIKQQLKKIIENENRY